MEKLIIFTPLIIFFLAIISLFLGFLVVVIRLLLPSSVNSNRNKFLEKILEPNLNTKLSRSVKKFLGLINKFNGWGLFGFILLMIGFILTPILIGLPMMVLGWLIISFSFVKRFTWMIPDSAKQTVKTGIDQVISAPATKSLLQIVKAMLKQAVIIFLILFAGYILISKKIGWW